MGGFAVTSDIARVLAAPLSAAERIKTLFGAALGDMEAGADVIAVPQMGEEGEDTRPARAALHAHPHHPGPAGGDFRRGAEALQARGYDVAAGRRAVLTGGACQLAGTRELAAAHSQQAGAHRPAPGFPRPGGRVRRARIMPPRSVF